MSSLRIPALQIALIWLLCLGVCWADQVRIQGQEIPYRLVDGKQMVSADSLRESFPGFESEDEWVDLAELCRDPNARVLRRNGLIVSVRYYDRKMAALYGPRTSPRRNSGQGEQSGETAAPSGNYRTIMDEIVRLSNIEREKHGAGPLSADGNLERSSTAHSEEMAQLNYFSHTSPTAGRESSDKRIRATGISPRATAENIAYFTGYSESVLAQKAVEGWMNSPGHRKNLLNPTYTHIGIGVGRRDRTYYLTQNFCAY